MAKGSVFPLEGRDLVDRETGVAIRQLTDYKGHSHHLYFTNSGWYDGSRKLLFASDRGNRTNLFAIDLASGAIRQLTDLDPPDTASENSLLFASLNPQRAEAYFWHGPDLLALDLDTLAERRLYRTPAGFLDNMTSVTADGRYVCTGHYADLSDRFPVDLLRGYVGFAEYWKARPHSIVVRIDIDSGRSETLFEENCWIGHVNASPTMPRIASFCHEGPWEKVDNRIWGLDLESGRHWPIRQRRQGEKIGHEYWLADGERIAFHGNRADGEPLFGAVRYDDSDLVEMAFPAGSTHVHSNDLETIVGDGTRRDPRLLLWRRRNGGIEGPRVLARHGGSSHVQITHVHPRLSPDGGRILYVSDENGYGNLYLADLPDFEGLPPHPAARLPATRRASSRARSMIARWRRRVRAIAP